MKSNKGFTLVELIVVIAIIAILAAVAIPVYSNYIKKANDAADLQILDGVKTAVNAVLAEKQVSKTADEIVVTVADGEVTDVTAKNSNTPISIKDDDNKDTTNLLTAVKAYCPSVTKVSKTWTWNSTGWK